ncbi:MAG: hypothetical protein EOO41_03335, partial [Methanobacteriota archaeon]
MPLRSAREGEELPHWQPGIAFTLVTLYPRKTQATPAAPDTAPASGGTAATSELASSASALPTGEVVAAVWLCCYGVASVATHASSATTAPALPTLAFISIMGDRVGDVWSIQKGAAPCAQAWPDGVRFAALAAVQLPALSAERGVLDGAAFAGAAGAAGGIDAALTTGKSSAAVVGPGGSKAGVASGAAAVKGADKASSASAPTTPGKGATAGGSKAGSRSGAASSVLGSPVPSAAANVSGASAAPGSTSGAGVGMNGAGAGQEVGVGGSAGSTSTGGVVGAGTLPHPTPFVAQPVGIVVHGGINSMGALSDETHLLVFDPPSFMAAVASATSTSVPGHMPSPSVTFAVAPASSKGAPGVSAGAAGAGSLPPFAAVQQPLWVRIARVDSTPVPQSAATPTGMPAAAASTVLGSTLGGPGVRAYHTMVSMASKPNRLVLFGGITARPGAPAGSRVHQFDTVKERDMWSLDVQIGAPVWQPMLSVGTGLPPPICMHSALCVSVQLPEEANAGPGARL